MDELLGQKCLLLFLCACDYIVLMFICQELKYERKQRNRRIFTRGGMLEAFLIEPLMLSDEDVHDFLEKVFRMPEVDSLLRKLIDDAYTLEYDESEKDAEDEENGGPFVEGRNYTPVTVQLRFCETFPREYPQNRSSSRFLCEKSHWICTLRKSQGKPCADKSATRNKKETKNT